MGCLYELIFPSGKSYIGISKRDAATRFERHVAHARQGRRNAVHRAIIKYGPESVVVRTLVVANDLQYLKEIERSAVRAYGTLSPGGYNMTHGGEASGFWAAESAEKHRQGIRRMWQRRDGAERRAKTVNQVNAMREALANPTVESERREKIRATMRSPRARIARGAERPNSKLSEAAAAEIRALAALGVKDHHIAPRFGVSRELVRDVRIGKRWKLRTQQS